MNFVIVEKNKQNVPTEQELVRAMTDVGGTNVFVEGTVAQRKVSYAGNVNHNAFENKLEEIAHGNKNSWNFIWGDSQMMALSTLKNTDLADHIRSGIALNSLLAATEKKVTIQIDRSDLQSLKGAGYCLCFAKKVGDNAYNVVWQSYTNYLSNNTFSWTPQYELFGSNIFMDKVVVDVSTNIVRIGLGETSILDIAGYLNDPSTGGPNTSITMKNNYGLIHPGVNQVSKSSMGGASASTPIYVAKDAIVQGVTELTPVEKILVWFQQNIETSTMFSNSRSLEVEIDLTNANTATRLYSNGKWSTP
jgi:hypothetical protein